MIGPLDGDFSRHLTKDRELLKKIIFKTDFEAKEKSEKIWDGIIHYQN